MQHEYQHFINVMHQLKNRTEFTVAFIGGSITQGAAATDDRTCYAYRVYQWWCRRYPDADIRYVNAGIGGTTSHLGAARVQTDILTCKPEVVFTDFCVNDENAPHFQETFEGLLRQILSCGSTPALFSLNNCWYNTGICAEEQYLPLLKHYHIPFLSIRDTLYSDIKDGSLKAADVTADFLHPNDNGHILIAEKIGDILDELYRQSEEAGSAGLHNIYIPTPLTENRYETARRITAFSKNDNVRITLDGFVRDETTPASFTDFFKKGFIGTETGDAIEFELTCKCLAIQYRKTVTQPTPVAKAVIDGTTEIILDGNFDEDWGDCLYLQDVLKNTADEVHHVRIEITETHDNDRVPFYLLSIIYAVD